VDFMPCFRQPQRVEVHHGAAVRPCFGLATLLCLIAACGEPTCPAGSEEIDGHCQAASGIEGADGGTKGNDEGAQADSGSKDSGSARSDASANRDSGGAADAATADGAPAAVSDCDEGFVPSSDGSKCVRDRCIATPNEPAACGEHGQCTQGTAAMPACACDEGYVAEDAECVRNPCVALPDDPSPCDPHASCTYEGEARASCACDEGYDGDGRACARNACVRLDAEPAPCGANELCTPTTPGEKTCACAPNFADCDVLAETGCEANLTNNASHCGACGEGCAAGLACTVGACADRVTKMSLGAYSSCALTPEGKVLCWGRGQVLYQKGLATSNVPLALDVGDAKDVAVGLGYACAVSTASNLVKCWGESNADYLLGGGDPGASYAEIPVAGARSIAAGTAHACAINGTGQVFCWGSADDGRLADGKAHVSGDHRGFDPRSPVLTVTQAVQIGVGDSISCALTGAGSVYCWGYDTPQAKVYEPEAVHSSAPGSPLLNDAVDLCVGGNHACARRTSGEVVCWGDNSFGQLGTGDSSAQPRSTYVVVALASVEDVVCRGAHSCARTRDGSLYCWGNNRFGQLGNGGGDAPPAPPAVVPGLEDIVAAYAGEANTCARLKSGRVYCWGADYYGELGRGTTTGGPVPDPAELMYWP
jgi:alpha-tubulin suppressor-like RCC1 family protein